MKIILSTGKVFFIEYIGNTLPPTGVRRWSCHVLSFRIPSLVHLCFKKEIL